MWSSESVSLNNGLGRDSSAGSGETVWKEITSRSLLPGKGFWAQEQGFDLT